MNLRRVQAGERVGNRRTGATKTKGQPRHSKAVPSKGRRAQSGRQVRDLLDASFDQVRLRAQTYFDIPELCAYLRFLDPADRARLNPNAAYCWLHETRLERFGGRHLRVRRRDVEEALERKRQVQTHAGQSETGRAAGQGVIS